MEEQRKEQLSDTIKQKSMEMLGYEVTKREISLMGYMLHVMLSRQKIDEEKVYDYDRKILSDWENADFIKSFSPRLEVSKKFWDAACELVYHYYVSSD